MQAHQSSLSPPRRPASFTGVCLCVSVWPSAPDRTNHLDHRSRPEPNRPWLFCQPSIHRLYCLRLPRSTSSPSLVSHGFRLCVSARAPAPRLKEHVHVSSPVKVTPYASCRDNEGFNFTTQAYQIAAPRSLRHALAT